MLYIHHTACISPQQTFGKIDIDSLQEAIDNRMRVIEPSYPGIPTGILRRMGKAIRLGVGTALPLIHEQRDNISGIIIGTANGGMEDCIRFLNQIIDYDEGMLTPTNFVQSTTNAIAAQVALLSANKGYNTTHVHRGLAFENALMDARMLVAENANNHYLVGGVDEISTYNYNIEFLAHWYKRESVTASTLYDSDTIASMAGEGAAMFLVNGIAEGARARLTGLQLLHTSNAAQVTAEIQSFLQRSLTDGEQIDLLLSGENGDSRMLQYYLQSEQALPPRTPVARFKHMMGEYPSVAAAALWLATEILQQQHLPQHMIKYDAPASPIKRILIYNNYRGVQHGFMMLEKQ